ncbi:MAG: hypothetical protein ACKKMP_01840 [Candidatus Nealsonbacteria bacterium]
MSLKNQVKLSLVIFLALSAFMIIFLIYPLFKDIKENATELSFKKQDSLYLDSKLKNIEDFRKDYKEIKANLEKGESLFVNSEAPVDFIGFLEDISEASNVSIRISPSEPAKKPGDPWYSIIFQVNAVSSFPDLLKLIEKLESGPYLVQIENINIIRLTSDALRSKELEVYSVGDASASFSVKAFAN